MTRSLSRRQILTGTLASSALAAATPAQAYGSLPSFPFLSLKRNQTEITMRHAHTEETYRGILRSNGKVTEDALLGFSQFARDWRTEATRVIAPQTIDILAEIQDMADTTTPFILISGYRTPQTNAMLRRTGHGVARNSYHIRARALDVSHPELSTETLYRAALHLQRGGVGKYTRSGFVHFDNGPVRSWGS